MHNVKFLLPTLKITCCTGRQWKLLITHQNPDVSLYLTISLSCHNRLFLYMFFWPSVWLDRWRWRRTCSQVTQVSCQGASKFWPLELFIIFTSSFIFLLTVDMSFNTTRDQNMITATEQQEVLTEPDSETSFCSLTFLWFTQNHQIKTVQSTLRPREQNLSWHHHVDWPVVGDEVEVDPGHVGSHHLQTLTGELRVGLLVRLQDLEPGLHQVRDALLPHAVFD